MPNTEGPTPTRNYLALLRTPGAPLFCAAGFLARSGGAMMGVGILMMVSMLYGSYGWAGAISAANGLAWAAGNAILARLVDRHGQARVMIPAMIATNVALLALIAAAVLHSPVWVLIAPSALSGLAGGSPGTLVRARWNHALGDSPQLHTAFSLESTLDEVTYIVGPVVATALATTVHPTAGLAAPVILSLTGGLWLYVGLRSTQPPLRRIDALIGDAPSGITLRKANSFIDVATSGDAAGRPPIKRDHFVLAFGGMVPVVVVTALFGVGFGAIDVATVAATSTWGARSMAGVALAAMSLGSAMAGLLYGARVWVTPLHRRFLIGVTAYAALILLYLVAHNVPVLIVAGFLAGSAIAPSFTNANSLVQVLVPKHRLTEGLAWIGTSIGLGASLGSSLGGQLIDMFGYEGGYWTAVLSVMASFVLAMAGSRTIRRHAMVTL